jgi:hypothetical protein
MDMAQFLLVLRRSGRRLLGPCANQRWQHQHRVVCERFFAQARCERVDADLFGGDVHASNGASRTDQSRYQKGSVAGATANIQHAHTESDAGQLQKIFGQIAEEPAGLDEALDFVLASPPDIRGLLAG